MAYPNGVSLAVVNAGNAFTAFGDDVGVEISVTPKFPKVGGGYLTRVIHGATGWVMTSDTDTFKGEPGTEISFSVPHVDQAGFRDPMQNAYTGWFYEVRVTVGSRKGKKSTYTQNVQPLVGQALIDLDLVPDGPVGESVSAPVPAVTSVNGATGAVNLDGEYVGVGEPLRVEHPAGSPVDAVKIINASTDKYALKVDQIAEGHDAVNIAALGAGGHTALGVSAHNTSLSTVKVTNHAAQTGGSVIAALGTDPARTAQLFSAENSGGGASYLSQMKEGATGTSFQAVYDGVTSFSSRIMWLKGKHTAGDLVYVENTGTQTAGSMLRLVQSAAGSTAPALSITNAGTGLSILAPSFEVRKNGNVAATAIFNSSTFNNSRISLNTNGTVIDRNSNGTTPALTVNQIDATSTGDVFQVQSAGSPVARVSATGHLGVKATTAPTDVQTGEAVLWVDTTVDPPRLMIAVKSAAGAITSTPA